MDTISSGHENVLIYNSLSKLYFENRFFSVLERHLLFTLNYNFMTHGWITIWKMSCNYVPVKWKESKKHDFDHTLVMKKVMKTNARIILRTFSRTHKYLLKKLILSVFTKFV